MSIIFLFEKKKTKAACEAELSLFLICNWQSKIIKSSLYWRYYAEACNEWWAHLRGKELGNTAARKRRSGGEPLTILVFDLTNPGMEPPTYRTDADVFNA